MSSIPRIMLIEEALGMTTGHAETVALVKHYLTRFEGDRLAPDTPIS